MSIFIFTKLYYFSCDDELSNIIDTRYVIDPDERKAFQRASIETFLRWRVFASKASNNAERRNGTSSCLRNFRKTPFLPRYNY